MKDCWRSRAVTCGGLVVSALDQRPCGREVAGSSPLAAGCRVATVGQLLFAPWAWAYSTLQPLGVGKCVPANGYSWEGIRRLRATLLDERHVPVRLYSGYVYLGRYIKCSTFTFTFRSANISDSIYNSQHRHLVTECTVDIVQYQISMTHNYLVDHRLF